LKNISILNIFLYNVFNEFSFLPQIFRHFIVSLAMDADRFATTNDRHTLWSVVRAPSVAIRADFSDRFLGKCYCLAWRTWCLLFQSVFKTFFGVTCTRSTNNTFAHRLVERFMNRKSTPHKKKKHGRASRDLELDRNNYYCQHHTWFHTVRSVSIIFILLNINFFFFRRLTRAK